MVLQSAAGPAHSKMRAVVQRVTRASVTVDGEVVGTIGHGLLVLLAVTNDDQKSDADYLAEKIAALRVFDDAEGRMNVSLKDSGGSLLVEVDHGVVTVTGKQCRHLQGEHAKKPKEVGHQSLAEVHMTLLTNHCQITWRSVPATREA